MNCTSTRLPYTDTGFFSTIITDYLQQKKDITPFYKHHVDMGGVKAAIEERKKTTSHRNTLVAELDADVLVLALGRVPVEVSAPPGIPVERAGDCLSPRSLEEAVLEGTLAARRALDRVASR